jgi:hypothetical protein
MRPCDSVTGTRCTLRRIGRVALDRHLHVFVAAEVALRSIKQLRLPALGFRIVHVHPQQIGSEQGAFGSTLASLDLHDHVASVIRISRDQQPAQLLLCRRQLFLEAGNLLGERLILVGEFARGFQVVPEGAPRLIRDLDLAQLRITPVDFLGARSIRMHCRIRELHLQLLVLFQQCLD